jgi:hypothetical protein
MLDTKPNANESTTENSAEENLASIRHISDKDRRAILDICDEQEKLKRRQAQVRDDIKAVALRGGMKTAQLSKILKLVREERAKGNVLTSEQEIIDAAEQVIGV